MTGNGNFVLQVRALRCLVDAQMPGIVSLLYKYHRRREGTLAKLNDSIC